MFAWPNIFWVTRARERHTMVNLIIFMQLTIPRQFSKLKTEADCELFQ